MNNITITPLIPRGFCKGVIDAWVLLKKIIANNTNNKTIYLIGSLVHNQHFINDLVNQKVICLDDSNIERYDLIKNIKDPNNSIAVFSAHGSDIKAIELSKQRNIETYDATCEYVYKVHYAIQEAIKNNQQIIFIGKKMHAETKAVMKISKNINFVETISDIEQLTIEDKNIFVTNQTTLSIYDIYNLIKTIKNKFKNVSFINNICNATLQRQEAIINMDKTIDLLLVVGDKDSNNSNKLVYIAKKNNVESYLINNVKEINLNWLKNKKNVGITSGTSTPTYLTTEVINFLKNY